MKQFASLFLFVALGPVTFAQNLDSIKFELERDYDKSLSLRQKVMPTIKKFGYQSRQMDSLNAVILISDSIALIRAIKIIDQYGWLGKSKIGELANEALYLSIQHADKGVREKYYPQLETSAKNGESNLSDMATMYDRILVDKGQPQLYGTQRDVTGKYFPIQHINGLNERRKKVGLEKIKINSLEVRANSD